MRKTGFISTLGILKLVRNQAAVLAAKRMFTIVMEQNSQELSSTPACCFPSGSFLLPLLALERGCWMEILGKRHPLQSQEFAGRQQPGGQLAPSSPPFAGVRKGKKAREKPLDPS